MPFAAHPVAHLGVKPDLKRWYGRRDRLRKLYNFFGRGVFRYFGLEQKVYSPPPVGRRGSKARVERKNYDREFRRWEQSQERKIEEILAGGAVPAIRGENNLSHRQVSKLLSGARLVCWQHKRRLRPALYCGKDLESAYYAYIYTKDFVSVYLFRSVRPSVLFVACHFPRKERRNFVSVLIRSPMTSARIGRD